MAIADNILSLDTPVTRSDSAASAEVDGQLVALDVTKGVCYGLNSIATRIWQIIENPISAREVSVQLLEEFEVEPAVCEHETLALMSDLVAAGLAR